MRERRMGAVAGGLALALVATLSGCSGETGTNASDQTQTNVSSLNLGPAEGGNGMLTVGSRNVTVEASVTWNNAVNDIDLYATPSSCPDPATLAAGGCTIITRAESTIARPERITFTGTANTTYKLFVINWGPGSDTVTLTFTWR